MRKASKIGIAALFLCFLFSSNSMRESRNRGGQFTAFRLMKTADQPAEAAEAPVVSPKNGTEERPGKPVVKSVVEMQPFRKTTSMAIRNNTGLKGVATLTNLNSRINEWLLLKLEWDDGGSGSYHLENLEPTSQEIVLNPQFPYGIVIVTKDKRQEYELWSGYPKSVLAKARGLGKPYAPICDSRLYLRNPTRGRKTSKELVTDFLRNHVWQGERIVNSVRDRFYKDAFLSTSKDEPEKAFSRAEPDRSSAPAPALLESAYENDFLIGSNLGIKIDNDLGKKVLAGRWYPAKNLPGIFISVIKPAMVSEDVIKSQRGKVNNLDKVEKEALVYLVAFDLTQFDVGYALGTDHPGVGWSDRVKDEMRDKSMPGPDGIGTVAPLVMTGMLPPSKAEWAVATFAGGFRRYHGAFRWGDLGLKNHGSHYGFIVNGVVLSKLQLGLATAIVYDDGDVVLKTWSERDNDQLKRIDYARQNGVPIIDFDETSGSPKPGALVGQWGPGNWSGSEEKQLRTLRAGLAIQENKDRRFLIYGYFSSATPSAMALVFLDYHCKYAMLMDMNALEHTYLAVYGMQDSKFLVQHLIEGMNLLDKADDGQIAPRFVGFADNRDFFYLLRRPHR